MPAANSSAIPADVCIPDPFTTLTIDFFDDYSWRAFVAMVWPAAKGQRGAPDEKAPLSGPGPRVFETFKSLWEIFHQDGSAPAEFDAYEPPARNACRATTGFGSVVLASFNGIDDIGQAGIGELTGPLVAQNGRYVRYQTLYNKIAYDFIVRNRYYLRSSLPEVPTPRPALPVMQFPYGSIAIKAAWLDMKGFPAAQQRRFYTRSATVKEPATGKCSTVRVGLVGLHIVQKTSSRPQWIWSSFEQVDSVPLFQGGVGKFTFNDGTPAPMPAENPLPLVPLARQPAKPFNVLRARVSPVHEKTVFMNQRYHQLLEGTVWKYYNLITTQWPLLTGNQAVPVPPAQTGEIFFTFPGTGPGSSAASSWANVTMETFDQARPELGCMSCHNQARLGADFLWSVLDHAWPAKFGVAESAVRH
ncbi:MAG: hypothetical protein JWP63_4002 [Candidatus Solibacter sp.]|nr:hypothetical protein [Candidatus Solibacter sp.]